MGRQVEADPVAVRKWKSANTRRVDPGRSGHGFQARADALESVGRGGESENTSGTVLGADG
jgi:hypothetical protein